MPESEASLAGKVALVTGAAQGMGEGFARRLHGAGARVIVGDINAEYGQVVAGDLGENCRFLYHDVTRWDSWQDVIAATEATFGPISILVNNAGIAWFESLESSPEEAARRMIDVDQMGVFLGMKAIIASMRKCGGGSIINIASVAGTKGTEGLTVYSACKWAVRGMTKCAALELGKDNIRVNAVHPGMIATAMTVDMPDPMNQPIQRKGHVDEVAETVLFLASDRSSYTTGCDFVVDGGMTIGCAGN